jgi:hypothetical protein
MPLHNRFIRVLTVAAMTGSLVILGGGALVSTAGPSSAATGGTNVCSSLVGRAVVTTVVVATEAVSGCHQQGSATVDGFQSTPGGLTQDTIHWATGHATSHAIVAGVSSVGAPCPAGDVTTRGTLVVIDGPYAGSIGHNVICVDLSRFPILTWTNLGPITI